MSRRSKTGVIAAIFLQVLYSLNISDLRASFLSKALLGFSSFLKQLLQITSNRSKFLSCSRSYCSSHCKVSTRFVSVIAFLPNYVSWSWSLNTSCFSFVHSSSKAFHNISCAVLINYFRQHPLDFNKYTGKHTTLDTA